MSNSGREYKTHCIVLKKIAYKETSLIINAISEDFGKISVMAKGVRKEKSQWLGLFDILNELELILYKNPSSDWYIFKSGLLLDAHLLEKDLKSNSLMQAAAELYKQIEASDIDNYELFDLLKKFLVFIPSVISNKITIFWRFLLRVLKIYGVELNLNNCVICGSNQNDFTGFFPQKNGFVCDKCSKPEFNDYIINFDSEVNKIIRLLPSIGNYIDEINLNENRKNIINKIFLLHLSEHFHQHIKLLSLQLYLSNPK